MRMIGLVIMIVWLLPMAAALLGMVAYSVSLSARNWLHYHLFGDISPRTSRTADASAS